VDALSNWLGERARGVVMCNEAFMALNLSIFLVVALDK
jgi:hypothetical protein